MRAFLTGTGLILGTVAVGAAAGIASSELASAMVYGAIVLVGG